MTNLLIVIESYTRWKFFSRIQNAANNCGINLIYLTICPSVYLIAKKQGTNIIMINRHLSHKCELSPNIYEETLDVKSKEIDVAGAKKIAECIYANIAEISNKFKLNTIFIYNGTTILGAVANQFAIDYKIKKLFFELANLPNKMFVDPKGTGALSLLYNEPEILKDYKSEKASFDVWRDDYINRKIKNSFVPQTLFGKQSIKDFSFYAIDKIYFSSLTNSTFRYIGTYAKKAHRYFTKKPTVSQYLHGLPEYESYIFFPMQVSHDSQLLIHSEIQNNLEAIEIASKLSNDYGVKLVVKPHPAETDKTYLFKVNKLKENLNFDISIGNTMSLILGSFAVLTINSTVGLEAKIAKKKVRVLGKAIYSKFDDDMLASYIMSYLIPINYFDNQPISDEILIILLNRASI